MHPTHRRRQEPDRTPRQACVSQVVDRVKSTMDLFGMLWFVIGNWWIFTSNTCHITSPSQFYLSLAFLVLGYFIITLPLFLCGAVIFCLPCVIVVMRLLRIADPMLTDGHHAGASEEVIQKLPILRFKALESIHSAPNGDNAALASNTTTAGAVLTASNTGPTPTTMLPRTARRLRWGNLGRWFKKRKGKNGNNRTAGDDTTINMASLDEPEIILAQADALCVICLNE